MPWSPQLTSLRNRLAILFPTQEDARLVVDDAQLDASHIAFDYKAINNWHSILSQAELRGKVEALVLAAIRHYGTDAELIAAYQPYMNSIGKTAQSLPSTQSVTSPATLDAIQSIKILFLAANPRDIEPLKLDEEVRAIDQALRQSQFRDHFDMKQHWAVRYSDLQEAMLRHQPNIVHFSGHGSAAGEIVLQDDNGASHPLSVRSLNALFSILRDNIRCVVLNACYSEQQAQAIAQHIEAVIGMSQSLSDQASINFASAFYQALGYGRSVQIAFELGCIELDLANLDEQNTPKLLAPNSNPAQIVFAPEMQTQQASIGTTQGVVIGGNAQVTQNFGDTRVNTGGGTYVAGDVNTGGDFVARDKTARTTQSTSTPLLELLVQHQRNLLRLQQQKAIYAAGEEPLRVLNQIEHEEQEIARIKAQLQKS